jgi:hypothetical protein
MVSDYAAGYSIVCAICSVIFFVMGSGRDVQAGLLRLVHMQELAQVLTHFDWVRIFRPAHH